VRLRGFFISTKATADGCIITLMLILNRDQVRRVDRLAIDELGITGVVLMENAGRTCAKVLLDRLGVPPASVQDAGETPAVRSRVAILCGGGNNGGDGYVIARHLHNAGVEVKVYSAVDPAKLTGDALINRRIVEKMDLPRAEIVSAAQLADAEREWAGAALLVDALLGTGFSGEMRPPMAAVIAACNRLHAAGKPVVAVDLPSGLDCDTGKPAAETIRADTTVTFVARKPGFLIPGAEVYSGEVIVAGIGVPPELIARCQKVP
jgi:NAD(P)H-hydrate epimerase